MLGFWRSKLLDIVRYWYCQYIDVLSFTLASKTQNLWPLGRGPKFGPFLFQGVGICRHALLEHLSSMLKPIQTTQLEMIRDASCSLGIIVEKLVTVSNALRSKRRSVKGVCQHCRLYTLGDMHSKIIKMVQVLKISWLVNGGTWHTRERSAFQTLSVLRKTAQPQNWEPIFRSDQLLSSVPVLHHLVSWRKPPKVDESQRPNVMQRCHAQAHHPAAEWLPPGLDPT